MNFPSIFSKFQQKKSENFHLNCNENNGNSENSYQRQKFKFSRNSQGACETSGKFSQNLVKMDKIQNSTEN